MNTTPPAPSASALRPEFWETNKRFLKLGSSGKLYYTEEGKVHFRELFSRYGFALENVTTLGVFRTVMCDIGARQLQENNAELMRLLHAPSTTAEERVAIADILGVAVPDLPVTTAASNVVSLAAWRNVTPGGAAH